MNPINENTIEQLINDLKDENIKLKSELEQAQQDIKDFEELAHIWKKGWEDKEKEFKRKLGNAKQTIKQLEKDLKELEELRAQTFLMTKSIKDFFNHTIDGYVHKSNNNK